MKNIHLLPTDKSSRLYYHCLSKTLMLWHLKSGIRKSPSFSPQNIYITNDEEIKEDDWVVEITTSPRAPYIGKTFYPKNDGTVTEEDLKKYLLSVNYKDHYETIAHKGNCSKIILTTDPDLIKDGVQAIDDEFLEWFVKNPSCEFVDVEHSYVAIKVGKPSPKVYKIITPKEEPKQEIVIPANTLKVGDIISFEAKANFKEEPKQETLEEASSKYGIGTYPSIKFEDYTPQMKLMYAQITTAFENGAKWQQEQNKNLYSEEEVIAMLESIISEIEIRKQNIISNSEKMTTDLLEGGCIAFESSQDAIKDLFKQFKKK